MQIFFPANLDHLLLVNRISASDLAKTLNVSRSTVATWTSGRGYPRVETLLQLVGILGVGLDELMFSNMKDPAYKDRDVQIMMAAEPLQEYRKLKQDYQDLVRRLEALEKHRNGEVRHNDDTKDGKG